MRIGLVPGHNQPYRPVTPAGELPLVGVAAIRWTAYSAREAVAALMRDLARDFDTPAVGEVIRNPRGAERYGRPKRRCSFRVNQNVEPAPTPADSSTLPR